MENISNNCALQGSSKCYVKGFFVIFNFSLKTFCFKKLFNLSGFWWRILYTHIYIYIYTYIYTHTYIHTYIYVHTYEYMHYKEREKEIRNKYINVFLLKKFFCNHQFYIFKTFCNAQFLTCCPHRIVLGTSRLVKDFMS